MKEIVILIGIPGSGKSYYVDKLNGYQVVCKDDIRLAMGFEFDLIDKFDYLAEGGKRKSTQHNFLCRMVNPDQKVRLSKEHKDFKWISSVGEAELILKPELKKTITKVLDLDQAMVNYPENELSNSEISEDIRDCLC